MACISLHRPTFVLVGVLVATMSLAQSPEPAATVVEAVDSPHVATLRQQAKSADPVQVADAVAALARLDQWDAVAETLQRIKEQQPDDATIAKFARQLGPVVMPMLTRNRLINTAAVDFVQELNAAIARDNDDPQVQQLRQIAATGSPAQLASAVSSLVRIGNWFVADELLTKASTSKIDDATLTEMAGRIEPALLLRMATSDKLSQPARDLIQQAAVALKQQESSPDRLRTAISSLASNQTDARLEAMRVLLAGGNESIRELVHAVVNETSTAQRDEQLRTMLRLSDRSVLALRQLALYGTSDVRPGALSALARIDRNRFTADLACALHAAHSTPAERQTATEAFARMGLSPPSLTDAVAYLANDLERATETAQLALGDDTITTLWEIEPDRKSVKSLQTLAWIAASRQRADAAARLFRIDAIPSNFAQDALIADVSYRVSVDPLWGSPEELKSLVDAYGEAVTGPAAAAALDVALQREDWAAAVGLIQFARLATDPAQVSQWLTGQAGAPAPLVRAAKAPIPRVRYEAATAIASLEPSSAYAGSSQVQETLAEMSRLTRRPIAIIVETIPDIISRQETLLTAIGFQVDTVVSVAELERRVAAGGDLRLVMSKSGLSDARPIELVDRVRRLPQGGKLPIIFFTDEIDVLGPNTFSVPTVQMPEPYLAAPITQLLTQWQRLSPLPPLIEGERILYRTQASQTLGIDADQPIATAP